MTLLAVAAAVAVMAGAALQSAVGFGFAIVAAPLLYAAAPSPEQAVGLMTLVGLEINLLTLLSEGRRPAPVWRDVTAVVAWSLPGALAGIVLLRALDDVALQLLVTAGVLVALAVNRRAARIAPAPGAVAEPPFWARPAAGLVSGALNTSTSTGGPPVVLLMLGRGLSPATVRDTLTTSFVGFAAVTHGGARALRRERRGPAGGLGRRAAPHGGARSRRGAARVPAPRGRPLLRARPHARAAHGRRHGPADGPAVKS